MEAFAKIYNMYKGEGVGITVKRALRKASRFIFETNNSFLFVRDLAESVAGVTPAIPVEVNFQSRDETIRWLKGRQEPWMFNEKEIEVGVRWNHFYPNAKYKGEIVGYLKIGIKEVYVDDFEKVMPLSQESAFIYDTYVLPSLRRHNIASFMICETMKFLRNAGIKTIYCHIPLWNAASINTYTKSGFRKDRYIRHIKILRLLKI